MSAFKTTSGGQYRQNCRDSGLPVLQLDQSPNLGGGACRCQCPTGRARPKTPQGLRVRPNLPVLPKLFRTSSQAVDPSGHCHCYGTPIQTQIAESVWVKLPALECEGSSGGSILNCWAPVRWDQRNRVWRCGWVTLWCRRRSGDRGVGELGSSRAVSHRCPTLKGASWELVGRG
jgi:hypothetical protein